MKAVRIEMLNNMTCLHSGKFYFKNLLLKQNFLASMSFKNIFSLCFNTSYLYKTNDIIT